MTSKSILNFSELKSAYTAILGITANANIHFYYAQQINELLKEKNNLYKLNTWFLLDTYKAHYKYSIYNLMLLHDKHPDAMPLLRLLNEMRKTDLISINQLLDIEVLNKDIKKLKQPWLKEICEKASKIRDKKFSHIDTLNAIGNIKKEMDETYITNDEIKQLIDATVEVVSNYCQAFINHNIQDYINPNPSVIAGALNSLIPYCFESE